MVTQQVHTQGDSANTNMSSETTGPIPSQDHQNRRRRRTRTIIFVAFVIIFHAIVLVTLDLTILKARTPKYRLNVVNLSNLKTNNSTTSTSFQMKLDTEVTIKNKNFGPYKYFDCYLTMFYKGKRAGDVLVTEASVKTYSTKKLKLAINVTYSESAVSGNSNLRNDISSGALKMSSDSEMRGQVELVKILKKDRYPKLHCTMSIDLAEQVVKDLKCD